MNAPFFASIPWLIISVTVWTAAIVVILLAVAVWLPILWRAGLEWVRDLIRHDQGEPTPVEPHAPVSLSTPAAKGFKRAPVVDIEQRRRQLHASATVGGRR